MEHPGTSEKLFLDDLAVGDTFTSAPHQLNADQIRRFAAEFDPQPFHLDETAARASLFQGLAASGWHTVAITMRLLVDSLPLADGVIGAGAEISWARPTRPGDILTVKSTILSITPSRSKQDRGIVVVETITSNQDGEEVQKLTSKIVSFRRR
ncbi:MaoC family dehydratase [Achromobacter denitrificans]|jgi:acyl dehydratase|uniref:MaoC family dehydratase n=1 Tax=Achromobacter denitrificans TaxID=32002 RepID=UPI000788DB06|nr:MaoC family dehydratase [Achromobacter denitrificans]MBV2161074.1 MaoC family dehydratase [Achromobacter denitrificans]OLU06328.1 dehydratase [Achromobacter denitrificans]QKH41709.1 MaoC family dehydratase [Achromobacter denitrificans]QKH51148.1 MaoC family dehydratase [Achromobacter denitrificans]WFC64990.1 MaoC family dehydratase [Achromobacter denitrificans]